jgi:tripartite-type tricarboxylate transporter receptor subunit TctC
MQRRNTLPVRFILLSSAFIASAPAHTADYPSKTIRLIVPFAAGGATDITSRNMAPRMAEALGQQVLVDNRPGGNAIPGTAFVAKAPPDGYTLLMATIGFAANPGLYRQKLPFDPVADFAPVSLVAIVPTILAVHPSIPVRSVRDLVALAKARPGALNFGSAGNGTINHLAGEMLKHVTGTSMTHVAYKGGSLSVTALISGEISMLFATAPTSLEFFRTGRLRPLAVSGSRRLPALPDVAPIGDTVPGFDVVEWQGIVLPAAAPKEVVAVLHREIVRALTDANVRSRIQALGADVVGGTPDEFAAHIRGEVAKWGKLAKETGLRAD